MPKHHHTHKKKKIRFEPPTQEPEPEEPIIKQPQEPFHDTAPKPTIKNVGFTSYNSPYQPPKSGKGVKKKKKKYPMEQEDDIMQPLPQVETILISPEHDSIDTNRPNPSSLEETFPMYPQRYYPEQQEQEQEPEKPQEHADQDVQYFKQAYNALMHQGMGFTRKLYH